MQRNKTYRDIVGYEYFPEIEHLEHGDSCVITDTISFQNVFALHHLPCQPPLTKRRVERQKILQMTRLETTTTYGEIVRLVLFVELQHLTV